MKRSVCLVVLVMLCLSAVGVEAATGSTSQVQSRLVVFEAFTRPT